MGDDTSQERAIAPCSGYDPGGDLGDLVGDGPVGADSVLTTQPIVVDSVPGCGWRVSKSFPRGTEMTGACANTASPHSPFTATHPDLRGNAPAGGGQDGRRV